MENYNKLTTLELYDKISIIAKILKNREKVKVNNPALSYITHEGKYLQKVDREVKNGDFVKFKNVFSNYTKDNIFYEIKDQDLLYLDSKNNWMDCYGWGETVEVEVYEVVNLTIQKTPNQQRKELLEDVRAQIENLKNGSFYVTKDGFVCNAEFEINKRKRTVKCRLVERHVRKTAVAKCHPDDVFNEDLGKLVSLSMCLEREVHAKFLDAVQPVEAVIGSVMKYNGRIRVVQKEIGQSYKELCTPNSDSAKYGDIIDDSNAQY